MIDRKGERAPEKNQFVFGVILTSAVFALPAIDVQLAWLQTFIPLPIFYYFTLLGKRHGTRLVGTAIIFSSFVSLFLGSFKIFLFSFTFLPAGFVLTLAVKKNDNPVRAGMHAILATVLCLLLFWALIAMSEQANPYLETREELEKSLEIATESYLEMAKDSGLPLASQQELQSLFKQLQHFILKVFPALLLIVVCNAIWLNIIVGHWLLKKKSLSPWKEYREWKLPEPLVWVIILVAVGLLVPDERINIVALNAALVVGTLYFFQGLAVLSSLLARWSVPQVLKVIIYLLVFIQAYGIMLLAVLGVADIWINLRKRSDNMA